MSEITKVRLLAMLDTELRQVDAMISNEQIWMLGSADDEQMAMHTENLVHLNEYKELLQNMWDRTIEDTLIFKEG